MAYMNQERKARIAAAVKPVLAKWGLKGTLSTNPRSITLTLRRGAIDFGGGYKQVNEFWIHDHWDSPAKEALLELRTALEAADWYNNSDSSIDYFDTAYYYNMQIGSWKKPYILEQSCKSSMPTGTHADTTTDDATGLSIPMQPA